MSKTQSGKSLPCSLLSFHVLLRIVTLLSLLHTQTASFARSSPLSSLGIKGPGLSEVGKRISTAQLASSLKVILFRPKLSDVLLTMVDILGVEGGS